MVTESAHLQIVLEARDLARAELQKTEAELRKLGLTTKQTGAQMSNASDISQRWGSNMGRTLLSMVSFGSILGVVGLSAGSLSAALYGLLRRQEEISKASTHMHNQLLLAGFSVERTQQTIDDLRISLNRTAFSALPGTTAEVRNLLAEMGTDARQQVGEMADKLTRLGVDPKEALAAATLAMQGDFTKLGEAMGTTVKDWQDGTNKINAAIKNMKEEPGFLGNIWNTLFAHADIDTDAEVRKYKEATEEIRKARLRALGIDPDALAPPPPGGPTAKPPTPPVTIPPWTDTSLPGQEGTVAEQLLAAVNRHTGPMFDSNGSLHGMTGERLTGMDAVNKLLQTMTPAAALAWARSWGPESTVFLAQGGIVRRPTLAMLGESGPEAVVPLGGASRGGAMQPIIIQIDGQPIYQGMLEFLDGQVRLREPSLGMG